VGTPQCEVKKIVMPVGPHEKKVWKSPVLKKHGLWWRKITFTVRKV
jgi:hypothetical protein